MLAFFYVFIGGLSLLLLTAPIWGALPDIWRNGFLPVWLAAVLVLAPLAIWADRKRARARSLKTGTRRQTRAGSF